MKIMKALEDIKEYCKNISVEDCNNRKCEIREILGDCIFSIDPEYWELNK